MAEGRGDGKKELRKKLSAGGKAAQTSRKEAGGPRHGISSIRGEAGVTSESVKVIAESQGVSNLSDEARQFLSDDVTYRLKRMLEESVKFMRHSKRSRLMTTDFDQALRRSNVEPLYGFRATESIPFRHASGAGREVFFIEDKELDLQDLITAQLPKVPIDISLKSHWLAIDGQQPAIPENPPPLSKDILKQESTDPSLRAAISKPRVTAESSQAASAAAGAATAAAGQGKAGATAAGNDKVRLKDVTAHELSTEHQLYYKEITEACVGSDEIRRHEALHSLATDPGLHQILPRFSTFIAEGVRVNLVQNNLALLIYLMRMTKSLVDNPTLYLEKYLHELIPALMSCIVSRQLCQRPDVDNHWALRDFAARLLKELCRMFSTSTNNVQVRITNTLTSALQSDTTPLATQYGAIVALGELGTDVVRLFVVPYVSSVAARLQFVLERTSSAVVGGNVTDRNAADHVKQALVKIVPPALKISREPPDILEEYRSEFGGYLGPLLHSAVVKLRTTAASSASTTGSSGPSLLSLGPSSAAPNIFRFQPPTVTLLTTTASPIFAAPSPFKQPISTQPVRMSGVSLIPPPIAGQSLNVGSSPRVQLVVQQPGRPSLFSSPSTTSASPARLRLVTTGPGTMATLGTSRVIGGDMALQPGDEFLIN